MVESLGYRVEWVTWDVPEQDHRLMSIYLEPDDGNLQRFTCLLRPA